MPSKFHDQAVSRISPEERALMVKSLEVTSQIHSILDRKGITQKTLAEMLKVSQAAVSKMLSSGSNLELNTVVKLEVLLNDVIIITPQKVEFLREKHENTWRLPENKNREFNPNLHVSYTRPSQYIWAIAS